MTVRVQIADLDVAAHVGGAGPEDAPQRLLPIYRSRTGGVVVVPPAREHEGALEGPQVTQAYLDALLEDEEATPVVPPFVARPQHTLWMSPAGLRYEPIADAEREADAWAVDAVREVAARGLRAEDVRDRLFGALRVRPTVTANALLAVCFELAGDAGLARPVREDLVGLAGRDIGLLDQRLLDAAAPLLSDVEIATDVVVEVLRADRADLATAALAPRTVTLELPDTCCSNVGGAVEIFRSCDDPAVAWYLHNGSVCSYCVAHDVPCGERLGARVPSATEEVLSRDEASPTERARALVEASEVGKPLRAMLTTLCAPAPRSDHEGVAWVALCAADRDALDTLVRAGYARLDVFRTRVRYLPTPEGRAVAARHDLAQDGHPGD